MRTTTDRLFSRLVTRTMVPKGNVGWQAVMAYMSNVSPLAVCRPLNTPPYQEATPWSMSACFALVVILGARIAGVGARIGGPGGTVAIGLGRGASACTVGT